VNQKGQSSISTTITGPSSLIAAGPAVNVDPNCNEFNGITCTKCSNRYFFGPKGFCVPVNPLCKSYSFNGACTDCYPGYLIKDSLCIITQSNDANCQTYVNAQCAKCYSGYYINSATGLCKRLNPLCKQSNLSTGACLTCYSGYSINTKTGNCEVALKDPNCMQFKPEGGCQKCSTRFIVG